ncbi:MAG: hypothetical protein RBT34_13240 [Anaerolineaceae bacterium]|nr:hypothetical protein [Anaerolineaceae bacterium]
MVIIQVFDHARQIWDVLNFIQCFFGRFFAVVIPGEDDVSISGRAPISGS